MSPRSGNLRNSAGDVMIDSILSASILLAYLPQFLCIISKGSVYGISPYFLLCNGVFSNTQLSYALLFAAYAYPNNREPILELIGKGELKGLKAFGGILGLIQITLQWMCSVSLAIVSLGISPSSGLSKSCIAAVLVVHAGIVLFPAAFLALPKPTHYHQMGPDLIIGLLLITSHYATPFFVILQFCPQFLEMHRLNHEPGALSLISLALQVVSMVAVAVRWLLRLEPPTWGSQPVPLWLWYQWGFLPFNYFLHGIGCAALLSGYLFGAASSGIENR